MYIYFYILTDKLKTSLFGALYKCMPYVSFLSTLQHYTHFVVNFCLFLGKIYIMVDMVFGNNNGFVWVLFWFIFMVVGLGEFFVHGDNAWFDAHATFYGADQNPTSLGEFFFFFFSLKEN